MSAPLRRRRALLAIVAATSVLSVLSAGCGSSADDPVVERNPTTTAASTTTGPVASTYATIPLQTAATDPTQTTAPTDLSALRSDGYGFLTIGMPLAEVQATGLITNPHAGCEGDADDQWDLVGTDISGTLRFVDDELDSISLDQGKVDGGGTIGMKMGEFELMSAARYDWSLDKTFAQASGIWIATLTDRVTGDTIDLTVDPATEVVEEATTPAISFC